MAELEFEVVSAAVQCFAVQPMMEFELVARNSGRCQSRSVILQSQIRIEAQRPAYIVDERSRLKELYVPPRGGTRSLYSLLWATLASMCRFRAMPSGSSCRCPAATTSVLP